MAWLSFSTLVGVLYFDLALTPAVLDQRRIARLHVERNKGTAGSTPAH